jgi:hypothetical protein
LYDPNLGEYKVIASKILLHRIYTAYLSKLRGLKRQTKNHLQTTIHPKNKRFEIISEHGDRSIDVIKKIKGNLLYLLKVFKNIYNRQYIIFFVRGII